LEREAARQSAGKPDEDGRKTEQWMVSPRASNQDGGYNIQLEKSRVVIYITILAQHEGYLSARYAEATIESTIEILSRRTDNDRRVPVGSSRWLDPPWPADVHICKPKAQADDSCFLTGSPGCAFFIQLFMRNGQGRIDR
jgi:hypothetical protein